MKHLLPIFVLTLFLYETHAQNADNKAIESQIKQFFVGMNKSDTTLVQAVMASGARLESVGKNKTGETVVRKEDFGGFYKSIAKAPAGALDERLSNIEIKTDGDLAIAWTPYKFYYNGAFSHCGVNVFQLARLGGQWKILSIIDTRRKEGCGDTK